MAIPPHNGVIGEHGTRFWGGGITRKREVHDLRAKESFEHLQPVGPEALVEAQPLVGAGERAGGEAAQMRAAAHLAPEQPGVLQHLDVLRGRGKRDREGGRQLADRARALGEVAQHLPARGVAEGTKDNIQVRGL